MRSGLSLEDLSTRTKVSVELWDAMERNDFSRWPTGVAARSYIRSYAEAVGVDPEATVDEFCASCRTAIAAPAPGARHRRIPRPSARMERRLASGAPEGDRRAPAVRPETASGLPWWLEAYPRHIAAGINLVAVVALAGLVAGLARIGFWPTLAVIALVYHGVSVALLGCTPTAWALGTYLSTQHPNVVQPPEAGAAGVAAAFRRLGLIRGATRSPERDTAS